MALLLLPCWVLCRVNLTPFLLQVLFRKKNQEPVHVGGTREQELIYRQASGVGMRDWGHNGRLGVSYLLRGWGWDEVGEELPRFHLYEMHGNGVHATCSCSTIILIQCFCTFCEGVNKPKHFFFHTLSAHSPMLLWTVVQPRKGLASPSMFSSIQLHVLGAKTTRQRAKHKRALPPLAAPRLHRRMPAQRLCSYTAG